MLLYAEAKGNNSFTRALRAAVELRLPSGAINKAVLSPVRIESPNNHSGVPCQSPTSYFPEGAEHYISCEQIDANWFL